ncbi:MAG TPA: hemolysin family protein [Vicinamibacterales bacterium]|jgi:CBS domain containing-hemolysin-like protein
MTPLLLFLIACGLVYLGTVEAAFSALMRLSLRLLAERAGRSETLGRYLDDPVLFFVPVRLLVGACAVVTTVLLMREVGVDTPHRLLAVVLAELALLVVCEHLTPLLIVRRDPGRILEVLLPSFTVIAGPLRPLTIALVRLDVVRRERGAAATPETEEQQGEAAQAYLEAGEQEGLIEGDERRLIQSIVEFSDTLVREVMTPRPDIVAIRAEATLGDLRTLLREQTYSRIPVFREGLDNILGFVSVKDLIPLTDAEDRAITTLMRPAYFVPETKKVSDLLKEFQRRQVQIAVVVDEYGGTAGLATLEDLIEEIVGEIRDEYDEESEPITDEGNGVFVFSGKVDIDEVNERLGVGIEREGFETVGGYLLSHLGRVPAVGEKFDVDDLAVEVLEAERRRVTKVRFRKREGVAKIEQ